MHKTDIITSELKKCDSKPDIRILPLGISDRCSLGLGFVDFFAPLAVLGRLPDCVLVGFVIKLPTDILFGSRITSGSLAFRCS